MVNLKKSVKIPTVLALLNKQSRQRYDDMRSFTITYEDDDTSPDLIQKAADFHGITPEILISRLVSEGLAPFYPDFKPISEFESLDSFMKENGFKK